MTYHTRDTSNKRNNYSHDIEVTDMLFSVGTLLRLEVIKTDRILR